MAERNTFDYGILEGSHDVMIAKILADEKIEQLAGDLGHTTMLVDVDAPIREMEAK